MESQQCHSDVVTTLSKEGTFYYVILTALFFPAGVMAEIPIYLLEWREHNSELLAAHEAVTMAKIFLKDYKTFWRQEALIKW